MAKLDRKTADTVSDLIDALTRATSALRFHQEIYCKTRSDKKALEAMKSADFWQSKIDHATLALGIDYGIYTEDFNDACDRLSARANASRNQTHNAA